MTKIDEVGKKLLNAAAKTQRNAYVLWGFAVGASVLSEDGKIYEGCNVESWISGLGVCAERNAVNHAVLHGNRKISKVALVMDEKNGAEVRPCGACLQYIETFAADQKMVILMAKTRRGNVLLDTVEAKELRELLPLPYRK